MLRDLTADDPRLEELLGSAHSRFQQLVAEAETKARPFYGRVLGREMGIEEAIAHVFERIDSDGDTAVCDLLRAFDGCDLSPERLRVGADEIAAGAERVDPELRASLRVAIAQVRAYQRGLLPEDIASDGGSALGARWTPLERVGAYVPGGTAGSTPLLSSVYMNLVPAQVAGVRGCVLCTPPRPDGSLADGMLAAAHEAGIDEVYRIGGIVAIAAMAIGTPSLAKVDQIVGPGNIFVTMAKRAAYGRVQLDMLAGPSEVLVIADGTCDPRWVAADLLSQAEHDVLAMAVLLSIDDAHADAVQAALAEQVAALPEANRATVEASLRRFGTLVRCSDLEQAAAISNRFAPEHLEVLVAEPRELLPALRHAGAIFLGPWSPEPIGDYCAGPSHTLPTGGSARMWSGVGADNFLRRTSIVNLDADEFRRLAIDGMQLARAEGLTAHERSIRIRLDDADA